MRHTISEILRLQLDHSQILQTIADSVEAAERLVGLKTPHMNNEPDADDARKLKRDMAAIHRDLSEHIRFEELEFLPSITVYADEIVKRGLLFEHKEILDSIADLEEKASALIDANLDQAKLVVEEASIIARLQDIYVLVEEHIHKQDVILQLAHLAIESLQREEGLSYNQTSDNPKS